MKCLGFFHLPIFLFQCLSLFCLSPHVYQCIVYLTHFLKLLYGEGPKSWGQSWQGSSLRYLTYLGMCLSTCIILQSSTTLAALVGLCVAAYISLSEYSIQNEIVDSVNPLSGAQIVR